MRSLLAAAVLAVTFTATACASTESGSAVLTAEGVDRELPKNAPVAQTVQGLTSFGHALYTRTAKPGANTVLSPLSIAYAYGMARAGATDATGAELDKVFGFPAEGPHSAFNTLSKDIVTVDGPPPKPETGAERDGAKEPAAPVVGIANGLFAQQGLKVGPDFLRTLTAQYGSGVRTVDFAGDATKTIDKWVNDQTAGRIKKLFDQLSPNTKVVLANAVYLKAEWEEPFVGDAPEKTSFTRADGSTAPVELMKKSASFRYAEGPGWQAVELPYAKGDLAMWILLPAKGGSPGDLLKPAALSQVSTGLKETQVEVALPGWDFATNLDLKPPMAALGLKSNDFSGITEGAQIDQAVHRANITVDEWGTEAAAVTGLAFPVMAAPSAGTKVRADHPFAFAIMHKPTSTPLFIGQVADPAAR
ncbi:serpin family protein [Streptosporangium sp. KLBMP 9127]|nr:serpin family protein [Streptosporangium sp. KLBMP 9127]